MAGKKDEIPQWVSDEIQNAKFQKPKSLKRSGYILEVYGGERKVDVQMYDPVEDGRHIVTMDLPEGISEDGLECGVVCEFAFDSARAPLDKKVAEFLQKEKGIEMDAIYQFKLKSMKATA